MGSIEQAGATIGLDEASGMTAAFRERYPEAPRSWLFNRQFIEELLNQDGAEYLRMYGGINAAREMNLVIVAGNAEGKDMLDRTVERGCPCNADPRCCDTTSPLYEVMAITSQKS